MYVPLRSAYSMRIPALPLSKVRKVTHLNASKPTSRNGKKSRMLDWLEITLIQRWFSGYEACTSIGLQLTCT